MEGEARSCFACGQVMDQGLGLYVCSPCEVYETACEEPPRIRMPSMIDPDTREEVFYFDHSSGSWPSPA